MIFFSSRSMVTTRNCVSPELRLSDAHQSENRIWISILKLFIYSEFLCCHSLIRWVSTQLPQVSQLRTSATLDGFRMDGWEFELCTRAAQEKTSLKIPSNAKEETKLSELNSNAIEVRTFRWQLYLLHSVVRSLKSMGKKCSKKNKTA